MKKLFFLFTVITFQFSPLVFAQAFTASFDQKISMNDKTVAEFHYIVKDKFYRSELKSPQPSMMMLRNEKGTFRYDSQAKAALEIPPMFLRSHFIDDLGQFSAYLEKVGAKNVGEETIGEYACSVYEYTEPTSNTPAKVWVWTEKNFPIKFEVKDDKGLTLIELSGIELGIEVDDETFELPKDTKLIQPNMGMTPPAHGKEPSNKTEAETETIEKQAPEATPQSSQALASNSAEGA